MRRRILSLLLCIVMMLSLMPTVAFAAGETWTITVHLNGGTGVESGTVEDGEYWTYPQPTKEGYTFAGWYTDASLEDYLYWSHGPVHSNLDLYAKWWTNITSVSASITLPVAGKHPDLSTKTAGDSSYAITYMGMSYIDSSQIRHSIDESYTFTAGEKIDIGLAFGPADSKNYEVTTSANATINEINASYSNAVGDSYRSKVFHIIYTVPNYTIQVNNGTANTLNGDVWQPVDSAEDGTEIQLVANISPTQLFDNWEFNQSVTHTQGTSASNRTTYITMPAGNLFATAKYVDVYTSQPSSGTATIDTDYTVTWSLNKTPTSGDYRLYSVNDVGVRTWKGWVNATSATISGVGKTDGLTETYCVSIEYNDVEYFSDNFTITWNANTPDPTTTYTITVNNGTAEFQDEPNPYGIRPWVTAETATAGTEIRLSADDNTEKLFSGWTFNQSVTYVTGASVDERIIIKMPAGNLIATANYVDVFKTQPQDSSATVGNDCLVTWDLSVTPISDNYRLYSVDSSNNRAFLGWANATNATISGAGKTAGTSETYCISIEYRSSLYGNHEYFSDNFTVSWTGGSVTPPAPTKYTVSFNMNGHGTQVADQTVEDGNKATKPADPTESGYTFDGWYADATFSAAFDFDTAINADTTIYAKWTKETSDPGTTDPQPATYTVTFNMNGHGTQVPAQTVEEGNKATKPADPTESGYTFDGWYADATFNATFDFDAAINANTTVYAKWTENTDPQPHAYTIVTGANSEWTKGGTAGLLITSGAPFAKFSSVKIDGSTIAASNYIAEEGSTKITLAPAYLETLSVGTHSIEIVSNDGRASTNFTIKAAVPPVPTSYIVSFNMNGHGTQITAQTVESGSKAIKPADPTANGYTFDGWYADAAFSAKFDFNTTITENTTVYAKWAKNSAAPTGDNSHLFLWIVLLLTSSGALVGTTVYGKKRKSAE